MGTLHFKFSKMWSIFCISDHMWFWKIFFNGCRKHNWPKMFSSSFWKFSSIDPKDKEMIHIFYLKHAGTQWSCICQASTAKQQKEKLVVWVGIKKVCQFSSSLLDKSCRRIDPTIVYLFLFEIPAIIDFFRKHLKIFWHWCWVVYMNGIISI